MQLVTIHLITLAVTVVFILYADYVGAEYLRGKRAVLNRKTIRVLHYGVWIGLIGMFISGALMAYPMWAYLVTEPAFLLKMFFVFILFVNGRFIGNISERASIMTFAELTSEEKSKLRISGVLSVVGWCGAAVIGFFFL